MGEEEAFKANIQRLRKKTRGVFIDEAHHLGGEQIGKIVEGLMNDNPRSNLAGFTATPIHANQSAPAGSKTEIRIREHASSCNAWAGPPGFHQQKRRRMFTFSVI